MSLFIYYHYFYNSPWVNKHCLVRARINSSHANLRLLKTMAATTATVAAAAAARSSSSLRFDLEPASNSKPFLHSCSSLKLTLKRCHRVSIRASRSGGENQAGDAYGGEVKKTEPIELGKLVEEYPFEFNSKDLPNPLPSTLLLSRINL